MDRLGIFRTGAAGTIQGAIKFHQVVMDEKLGNLLIPKTEEDYQDLKNGSGNNIAYIEMTPEEMEVAGLDLRVYRILSKEKVDMVFSLNQKEQYRIIKVLNDNLQELLDSAGKHIPETSEDTTEEKNQEEEVVQKQSTKSKKLKQK